MTSKQRRSEDLGGMGESFFRLLAKDAQLVVNSSTDDKAGWDFVVEDSSPLAINYGDHSRAVYRIQVKATMGESSSIQMSFSSLLSLIQYGGPTFVFLLKFKDGLSPESLHVVHLGENESIEILKALRRRDVLRKNLQLNKAKYSLRFDKGTLLSDATGKGLRNYLEAMLGGSYIQYVEGKAKWLRGIEQQSSSLLANMQFKSEKDFRAMVDCFLGYESKFCVSSSMYRAPFGIADPESIDFTPDYLTTVTPIADKLMRGVLRLRTSAYGAVYQFKVTMYAAPPSIPKEFSAFRLKTSMFDVVYRFNEQCVKINVSDLFCDNHVASVEEVWGFVRYMREVAQSKVAYVEVALDGDSRDPLRLTVDADATVPEDYEAVSAVIELLYFRFTMLGLGQELIKPASIFDVNRTGFLSHVGESYEPVFSFDFSGERDGVSDKPDAVIFSFPVELQDRTVVCYAAFYGEVVETGSDEFHGDFYRSEYLGEIVVPHVERIDVAQVSYVASLRERLLSRGVKCI
ncbi:hypothetical protein [Pseudomonas fulva]|uniref:hypothetical protein n=1 Tax=Pseudomonas fulva TaxID=47880 RepID=UPI0034636266